MRLPPHSAEIMHARRAGMVPTPGMFGHVAVLPDWDFETSGAFVLAPPSLAPSDLDFSFLAGLECSILLRDCDMDRLQPLLVSIMNGDPRRIVVVSIEHVEEGLSAGVVGIFERRPPDRE